MRIMREGGKKEIYVKIKRVRERSRKRENEGNFVEEYFYCILILYKVFEVEEEGIICIYNKSVFLFVFNK